MSLQTGLILDSHVDVFVKNRDNCHINQRKANMINVTYPNVAVRTSNLPAVLYQKDMIRAMAVQLVTGQVEAHLDIVNDAGLVEYGTFEEISQCIAAAKESVGDYVEDLLDGFRDSLYAEIAKVKIETKAVLLKASNDIDADVEVTIGE